MVFEANKTYTHAHRNENSVFEYACTARHLTNSICEVYVYQKGFRQFRIEWCDHHLCDQAYRFGVKQHSNSGSTPLEQSICGPPCISTDRCT